LDDFLHKFIQAIIEVEPDNDSRIWFLNGLRKLQLYIHQQMV